MFADNARFAVPPHVFVQTVDDESVLLDTVTERYFGLNDVGAVFLDGVSSDLGFGAIVEKITSEFDVDADQATSDLGELARSMIEAGLLTDVGS